MKDTHASLNPSKQIQFKRWTLFLLIYTVLVILWGAWVRISHSGDGCGDTWPLCNGLLIPEAQRGKTWVEFGHRLMSGVYGILVVYLWFKSRKIFSKTEFARRAAFATLVFMIIEALLGAKLVLFKLVTTNATPYRAFVMGLHQVNSFLLTGAVAFAYFAASANQELNTAYKIRKYKLLPWIIILIGVTGAWAALSNSLFPSENLLDGLMQDFSPNSHFLVRLRILHPFFAIVGAGGLSLFFWLKYQTTENLQLQKAALLMTNALVIGILFGMATLFLHAPLWMKIAHLAIAHTLWVLLLNWIYQNQDKV
jgi:cytochrome c oxidase assembly protein subunit 15